MRAAAEGRVPREGFDLHYRTVGSGTPAVLLSGGPGLDVDYMSGVDEQLPSSCQCIFLEQRVPAGRDRRSSAAKT